MKKDAGKLLENLGENLKFFSEIGLDFLYEDTPELNSTNPSKKDLFETLVENILQCSKCRLCETRTHAVPGEGDIQSPLMFIGEGPGHDEDLQGRPFVGKAGQLLTKIINAMEFQRSQVYIANVVNIIFWSFTSLRHNNYCMPVYRIKSFFCQCTIAIIYRTAKLHRIYNLSKRAWLKQHY